MNGRQEAVSHFILYKSKSLSEESNFSK